MATSPRMPREARRAQLLEAAAATFRQGGYDKTSVEQIAQTAGVSRLIIYRIFGTKEDLYREVLRDVLADLASRFVGLSFEDVAERGAASVILPVARTHPDAFRLLWRDAWHQPPFEDIAEEFRSYVTIYARAILSRYLEDEVMLQWASLTGGAHLIEGICNWLDHGDPARDDAIAQAITAGIRGMATGWVRSSGR
jgi:AcrR family transcriptional regulator